MRPVYSTVTSRADRHVTSRSAARDKIIARVIVRKCVLLARLQTWRMQSRPQYELDWTDSHAGCR